MNLEQARFNMIETDSSLDVLIPCVDCQLCAATILPPQAGAGVRRYRDPVGAWHRMWQRS